MALTLEFRGEALSLRFITTALDETCFDLDCERTPSHWTVDGLDGYCTACRKHAPEAMQATLDDVVEVADVRNGRVVLQ